MAANVSAISILFGLNSGPFAVGIKGIMGQLGGLKNAIAGAFAGVGIAGGVGFLVKLAAEAEATTAQMEVLLGSVGKAQQMINDIRSLDEKSPFGFQDLAEAAKRMLAYGIAGEEVIPVLTRLSEVAMGDAFKLDRLAFVMGQVKAATKLTAQDLRQFTEAGLNPLAEISRLTGLSMEDLREKVTNGEISYKLITLAIQAATEETGRFYGANARFAKTLQGEWGKLVAEARGLGREIGAFLIPVLKDLLVWMREGVSWLRSWDASQLKVSASILAFGITLTGTMAILSRIPAIIKTIVVGLKAMALGQVKVQALSGPKGWLILTGSLIAAGVATGLVVDQFKDLEKQMAKASEEAAGVAKEADKIGARLPDAVLKIKEQMELELDIKGAKDIAEGGKAFSKAAEKLRPGALLKGSAEAESAINQRNQPKLLAPEVKAAAAAVGKVPGLLGKAVALLDRIERGMQPVAAANV